MEGRKIVKVVGRVHSYASIAFAQRRIGSVSALDRLGEALNRASAVTQLIYEIINCESYISPCPSCQNYQGRMRVKEYVKSSKSSQKL